MLGLGRLQSELFRARHAALIDSCSVKFGTPLIWASVLITRFLQRCGSLPYLILVALENEWVGLVCIRAGDIKNRSA